MNRLQKFIVHSMLRAVLSRHIHKLAVPTKMNTGWENMTSLFIGNKTLLPEIMLLSIDILVLFLRATINVGSLAINAASARRCDIGIYT